jgi:hypothetical protein
MKFQNQLVLNVCNFWGNIHSFWYVFSWFVSSSNQVLLQKLFLQNKQLICKLCKCIITVPLFLQTHQMRIFYLIHGEQQLVLGKTKLQNSLTRSVTREWMNECCTLSSSNISDEDWENQLVLHMCNQILFEEE